MKKCIVGIILAFLAINLSATPVKEEIARKAALNFLTKYSRLKSGIVDLSFPSNSVYNGLNTFYAFSINGGGWILISADDVATPVLAYSNSGEWNEENINPTAKKWIENYSKEIFDAVQNHNTNAESQTEWQALLNQHYSDGITTVLPLLTTLWDQSAYYNDMCPASISAPGGYGGKVPTGCVATTMAQIMKYYNYPAQGVGSFSYNHPAFNTLAANFGSTDYNWSSMPTKATSANPALATLMFHCGVAVQMNYDPQGSGAASEVVPYALKTYFNYDNTMQLLARENVGNDEIWRTIIKTELEAGRPVYYAGSGSAGGHAFVCDGYDASNPTKFHINWGWSGNSNGYFAIGALTTSNGAFNEYNRIIVGIKPRSNPGYICRIESPSDGSKINIGTDTDIAVKTVKGTTTKVILYLDGIKKDSSVTAPFNFKLNTGKLTPGIHTLSVKATDGTNWDYHESEINLLANCWQLQQVSFSTDSVRIEQIFPVNDQVVWAVIDDYSSKDKLLRKFIKTSNGGTSWTEGTINCTSCSSLEISGIFPMSETKAYACLNPGNSTGGAIVYTEDGGTTWIQQTSADFTASWANWIYFFDDKNGVCMGDSYKPLGNQNYTFSVFTTSDGGSNWTRVTAPNLPAAITNEAGTVNFFDAVGNTIWFGTGSGRVFKSTDKGLTWNVYNNVLGAVQTNVSFKDANNGFAYGGYGSANYGFKKTTDGGNTWTDAKPMGVVTGQDYEFVPGSDSLWINSGYYSSVSLNNNKSYFLMDQNTPLNTTAFINTSTGWGGGYYSIKEGGGIYKWVGNFAPKINSKVVFVIKENNGALIPNASIDFNYQTKSTDNNGLAVFDVRNLGNPETYRISKTGYATVIENYEISTADTVKIVLVPSCSVTFVVKNKSDAPVGSAAVIFNGQSQFTDANGTVTFTNVVKASGYPYAVTKSRFYAGYGRADIKESTNTINVTLIADATIIKHQEKITHVVFPNPASDLLNIMSETDITGVEIVSMNGRIVAQKSFSSKTVQLPVNNLKKGEYILKVKHENKEERSKIMIK